MASFDFIESASEGYKFVWEERRVLVRLAFVPFLIKLVSYAVIIGFGLEDNLLRQGWLLIPSYFAEAWLIAVTLRFAIFAEAAGPAAITLDPARGKLKGEDLDTRRRNIMGCILAYVLMKLAVAFVTGSTIVGARQSSLEPNMTAGLEGEAGAFFFSAAALAVFIWAFRFIWLYVPVALGYRLEDFVRKTRGFMTSVYMLGFWMICFLPFAILVLLASELMLMIFPPVEGMASAGYSYAMAFSQVAFELMIALISSVGMAHGVVSIMKDENKRPSLF